MSASCRIIPPRLCRRRAALLGLGGKALAQGFAGLGESADGFAAVVPGRTICVSRRSRPASGIPHRVVVRDGEPQRCRWRRLWRAMDVVSPGRAAGRRSSEGWANQQVWMGHAAVTRADTHRYDRNLCARRHRAGRRRGRAVPCLDRCLANARARSDRCGDTSRRSNSTASAADFSYALRLDADRPLVLQGDGGYSRKSERGQASYYYSQPFFKAAGRIAIDDKPIEVTGLAWMDREWSSQPLASDQTGWDWFSLHLERRRKADAVPAAPEGRPQQSASATGSRRTAVPSKSPPPTTA